VDSKTELRRPPVLMWSETADESDLLEFDSCALCGLPTSLLVFVRLFDTLPGICGLCIDELSAGYRTLYARRSAKIGHLKRRRDE
jgi:hypothetical protein